MFRRMFGIGNYFIVYLRLTNISKRDLSEQLGSGGSFFVVIVERELALY